MNNLLRCRRGSAAFATVVALVPLIGVVALGARPDRGTSPSNMPRMPLMLLPFGRPAVGMRYQCSDWCALRRYKFSGLSR